jgi:uncharacterized protein
VHFARWRAQTWEALGQLEGSGSLTEHGARLVARLRETVAPWLEIPVGAQAQTEAVRKSDEHRSTYENAAAGD